MNTTILGIPSILFGVLFSRCSGPLRWGELLLALNGAACIVGVAGLLLGSAWLSLGTAIGGVLYLLALFPLSWGLWRGQSS